MYSIQTICEVISGQFLQQVTTTTAIAHLVFDSRNIPFADVSLFFALAGHRQNGHSYSTKAYQKGVRNFVVDEQQVIDPLPDATIISVPDPLGALQQLAAFHRSQFSVPVIGITGSNGKTVVKEWLYQLLQDEYNILRSPKSYNSQIGVPLSVWQLNSDHTLAIFEAGISQVNEMQKLARIIQPTIGVLTNIGEAHNEGFTSMQQKLDEKLKLFVGAKIVIGGEDFFKNTINQQTFLWGESSTCELYITVLKQKISQTILHCNYKRKEMQFVLPFTDEASVQNCITCISVLLYLNYNEKLINERVLRLHAVDMRLQLKHGINHCTIINDSYSADLTSFNIALHFLVQQRTAQQRTAILSDFVESGKSEEELYKAIADGLRQNHIQKLIAVGEKSTAFLPRFLPAQMEIHLYQSTEEFIQNFRTSSFYNETILVKGARKFEFEKIVQLLETKQHQTVLEINLNAIVHNLKEYQKILQPGIKVMAMVKAFSYGSGGAEIASILQFNNVDYLGVAYVDEGIELRKAGIGLPVMVMNVDASSFASLVEYNLQPVVYSLQLLRELEIYLKKEGLSNFAVHLEIETGMNRLGFAIAEMGPLGAHLAQPSLIKIESVFSHLASSEDAAQDEFTKEQAARFQGAVQTLSGFIPYFFLKHLSNSAAIIRHPELQMDMVRLGIGLYGVEIGTNKLSLQPVATLRSTIAQIKHLKAGETVSYNRRGVVKTDSVIATVRIGYADGYSRRLGNGVGKMRVKGRLVPVIGTVCMDMTMIDITGVPHAKEGDEVIIFGKGLPVQQLAEWEGTIPYELMTSISQRVKRVYFQE